MACSCGGDSNEHDYREGPVNKTSKSNPIIADAKTKLLSSDLKNKVDSKKDEATKKQERREVIKRRLAKQR